MCGFFLRVVPAAPVAISCCKESSLQLHCLVKHSWTLTEEVEADAFLPPDLGCWWRKEEKPSFFFHALLERDGENPNSSNARSHRFCSLAKSLRHDQIWFPPLSQAGMQHLNCIFLFTAKLLLPVTLIYCSHCLVAQALQAALLWGFVSTDRASS